jgi:hypothetical protein
MSCLSIVLACFAQREVSSALLSSIAALFLLSQRSLCSAMASLMRALSLPTISMMVLLVNTMADSTLTLGGLNIEIKRSNEASVSFKEAMKDKALLTWSICLAFFGMLCSLGAYFFFLPPPAAAVAAACSISAWWLVDEKPHVIVFMNLDKDGSPRTSIMLSLSSPQSTQSPIIISTCSLAALDAVSAFFFLALH